MSSGRQGFGGKGRTACQRCGHARRQADPTAADRATTAEQAPLLAALGSPRRSRPLRPACAERHRIGEDLPQFLRPWHSFCGGVQVQGVGFGHPVPRDVAAVADRVGNAPASEFERVHGRHRDGRVAHRASLGGCLAIWSAADSVQLRARDSPSAHSRFTSHHGYAWACISRMMGWMMGRRQKQAQKARVS